MFPRLTFENLSSKVAEIIDLEVQPRYKKKVENTMFSNIIFQIYKKKHIQMFSNCYDE